MDINLGIKKKVSILALGAESAGNFCFYKNGKIYFSKDFGDLLDEKNFQKFKISIIKFLKKNKLKSAVILTDLHPLYKTTLWGQKLAEKFKAKHIQVQHQLAHIFSAIGEKSIIENCKLLARRNFDAGRKIENCLGIACDGTGYGLDGKIWGGEIFKIKNQKSRQRRGSPKAAKIKNIERIGHLENQILIGGDLAIREPARMLISILSKFLKKEKVYKFVKKFYTQNQFELLYNQLQQNFNCQETSSTGRILDTVSLLLKFCENERKYKHEPIDLLEKNSTEPYSINSKLKNQNSKLILETTPLFEYLINNLDKDKKRLAATAQLYIAKGLYKICRMSNIKYQIFFAGGIANNKIISSYLELKGVYSNKKIPRGDAGLSFGQIIYYLLTNPRN